MKDDLGLSDSKRKKLIADCRLLQAHLQLANEIATRLGAYLDPVQGSAPKRGRKLVNADLKARIIAKRNQTIQRAIEKHNKHS